ncbi:DNA polymerase III subunit gamma/tau [Massiliimalia timonensis]|uniref:DNA polymerase III subunit gamma/tau n=1 Tax=Massiliimalia timonensis TaxID=1987501 RepID=UPI001E2C990A|nr:DNA polymerase III subunit gamma/tau [Massiliimalia timonensis]
MAVYLALYRKWRPKTFDDVISQEHITTTLKREIVSGKTAHSYLFTGSRGTGKTTCAKILAMAVNCPHTVDGNPCMECEICKGIEDGSILDVQEIDAASNNGVDDVRLLREEANYLPAQCKYRVYIIDETHMLSTSAFNALLKIMEEPPEHVKFILATTEVHKVPATVLSRCQRFDFGRIKTEDIAKRVLYIAEHESFSVTEEAAFLVARLADGGMRDALSILDQCVAFSDAVDTEIVSRATGLVSRDYLFDLTDMFAKASPSGVLACVDELYSGSKDLQKLVDELIGHYRNLMIAQTVPDCQELVNCLPDELARLKEQANQIPMRSILRGITVLQECLDQIGRSYDKRLCVEMAFLKLCMPELDDSSEALAQRLDRLEAVIKSGDFAPVSAPQAPQAMAMPEPAAVRERIPAESVKTEPAPPAAPVKAAEPMPMTGTLEQPQPFDLWPEVLAEVTQLNPALAGVLSGSLAYEAGEFLLIDSPIALFGQMIKQEGFVKTLLSVLEQKTGHSYKIRVKKAKKQAASSVNPLDEIARNAQRLGIDVREK